MVVETKPKKNAKVMRKRILQENDDFSEIQSSDLNNPIQGERTNLNISLSSKRMRGSQRSIQKMGRGS